MCLEITSDMIKKHFKSIDALLQEQKTSAAEILNAMHKKAGTKRAENEEECERADVPEGFRWKDGRAVTEGKFTTECKKLAPSMQLSMSMAKSEKRKNAEKEPDKKDNKKRASFFEMGKQKMQKGVFNRGASS